MLDSHWYSLKYKNWWTLFFQRPAFCPHFGVERQKENLYNIAHNQIFLTFSQWVFIVVSLSVSKLDKSFMRVFLLALRNHTDEGAEVLNYPDAKQFSRQGRILFYVVGTLQVPWISAFGILWNRFKTVKKVYSILNMLALWIAERKIQCLPKECKKDW